MSIENYYRPLEVWQTNQRTDEYGDPATAIGNPADFLGYIGKPNSAAATRMAQRGVYVSGRLYAPIDAPVGEFCVIVEPETGEKYQVISRPRDAGKRGHHLEADLVEWKGGAFNANTE